MNSNVNIKKSDGTVVNAELICYFKDNNNNEYVYYTLNEVSEGANSTVKIYISKVKQNNPAADMPIAPAEWDSLKGYMASVLKDEGIDNITYLKAPAQIETISDMAIAMPTSYDYIKKHQKVYNDAISGVDKEMASTENLMDAIQTAVPTAPEPTPTPAAPTSAPEPAPVAQPTPQVVTPTPEPVSEPEPTPAPSPAPEPQVQEAIQTEVQTPEPEPLKNNTPSTPLDVNSEVAMLDEIISEAENLKAKFVEIADRYNSIQELNDMQISQRKEAIKEDMSASAPASAPQAQTQVQTPSSTPTQAQTVAQTQASVPPAQGPTPVTPVVPDATPVTSQANATIETNWFDMPQNQA